MPETVALVAPTARLARAAARRLARERPDRRFEPYSLEGFRAAVEAPDRIVLCPSGRRLPEDLAFLRAVRDRLLWPAPPADLADAIASVRSGDAPARAAGTARRRGRPVVRALLLEGEVTAARTSAALASGDPRDWIVEDCRRVRVTPARLEALRRRKVRWLALVPVGVLAIAASPALARARNRWKGLVPQRTPIWITGVGRRETGDETVDETSPVSRSAHDRRSQPPIPFRQ